MKPSQVELLISDIETAKKSFFQVSQQIGASGYDRRLEKDWLEFKLDQAESVLNQDDLPEELRRKLENAMRVY